MIEIKTDPPAYRTRRHKNGFGQGLVRIIFFALMLIPTIIIAWRIDLVNPQPQTVIVQQPPSQPPPVSSPTQQARPPRQRPVDPKPPVDIVPVTPADSPAEPSPKEFQSALDDPLVEETPPPATTAKQPSAIVPLDLQKAVFRVIATVDAAPIENVLCDVGFSYNLLEKGAFDNGHQLVAEKLGHRGKKTVELPARIVGAGAAIEIAVIHRRNDITCELRPKMLLASGTIHQFTKGRGELLRGQLLRQLDEIADAKQSLKSMQNELRLLESQHSALQRRSLNDPIARGRLPQLAGAIRSLGKNISRAEQLIPQERAARDELGTLNKIGEYAQTIASVSTISVRFYTDKQTTLPATVK
jgi:hypothetical protein